MDKVNIRPLVSVIVPVYNVEQYLNKCIKSIQEQTYSNLEIILIDDGSTDNSGTICDKMATTDNRIKVFHQSNGGVSAARNFGLEQSTGEYIIFCDSDDSMLPYYVSSFHFGFDFCQTGYTLINKENTEKISLWSRIIQKDVARRMISLRLNTAPWAKLLRKTIINKHHIRFPESISYGEDMTFIYQYLSHCQSAATVSGNGYEYYIRNNTSLGQRHPPKEKMLELWKCVFNTFGNVFSLTDKVRRYYLMAILRLMNDWYQMNMVKIKQVEFLWNECQNTMPPHYIKIALSDEPKFWILMRKQLRWYEYRKKIKYYLHFRRL